MLYIIYTEHLPDRETDQRTDYSDYLFIGQYIPYYICDYYVSYTSFAPGGVPTGTCYSPNLYTTNLVERVPDPRAALQHRPEQAGSGDRRCLLQRHGSSPNGLISPIPATSWLMPGCGSGNGFGPNSNYPYDGEGGYRVGEGPSPGGYHLPQRHSSYRRADGHIR